MQLPSHLGGRSVWPMLTLAASLLGMAPAVRAATPADFGYQNMRINGHLAANTRPLLLIIADFSAVGVPPLAHDKAYFEDFVFNVASTNGVNSYLWENSNGRFQWQEAGVVGPLTGLGTADMLTNYVALGTAAGDVHKGESMFFSNLVYKAMLTGFDFARFDSNHDNTITEDELSILIISNTRQSSGQNRPTLRVQAPGSPVAVDMSHAAEVSDAEVLNLIAHESTHTLGTVDIYGGSGLSASANLSLYADCLRVGDIYHLDPWHKMQLGWDEPRLVSLSEGGAVQLPAAQLMRPDAPVVLYDSAHGLNEFFMLEYRTRQTASRGAGYDRNVAGNGLVIWRVKQDVNMNPIGIPITDPGSELGQPGWYWCHKCQGLVFWPNLAASHCPAGGQHETTGSYQYQMVSDPAATGESEWRWCHKCQGLFFGPNQASSHCPASGTHENAGSDDYRLVRLQDDPNAPGQHEWRRCAKCQGLFYGPGQADSICPLGGQHDGSSSADYSMTRYTVVTGVIAAGAPDLTLGANTVWGSGVTTPILTWLDGSATRSHIQVEPFQPGDDYITVQIITEGDTWVDFNYLGSTQDGSFAFPFKTFTQGLSAVSYGGTLHVKTGASSERASITKAMNIQAYNGPVTIGN